LHAKTTGNVPNPKIGDFANGGAVFWLMKRTNMV